MVTTANLATVQIGGSRALAVTSDRDAASPLLKKGATLSMLLCRKYSEVPWQLVIR